MTFALRLVVISLATFAFAGLVVTAVVPWLIGLRVNKPPAARAAYLFRVRLLPAVIAVLATFQGVVSFEVFEPRGGGETFGYVLIGLAGAAAVLWVMAALRLVTAWLATERALRRWMSTASPLTVAGSRVPGFAIDTAFPVVAVVGILRPRLVVARSVLAACPPDEMLAILAHEEHHLRERDNVRRAVLAGLPDPMALLPVGRRLNREWHDVAETAADDHTLALGDRGRLNLAAALLRVARLVPAGQQAIDLPASALYRGENLERRVRRLLTSPVTMPAARTPAWRRAAMTAALIGGGGLALHAVHEIVEAAVTLLP